MRRAALAPALLALALAAPASAELRGHGGPVRAIVRRNSKRSGRSRKKLLELSHVAGF